MTFKRKERVIKVGWPTLKVLFVMSVGVRVGPSLYLGETAVYGVYGKNWAGTSNL